MKLKIDNTQVTTFEGSTISIVRKSPLFSDQTGAFSYPFPLPRRENNNVLGLPGRLERFGDIPEKNFVLETDREMNIMSGVIAFDKVNEREAGIILQSGMTEFYAKMNGKKLSDIDFGSEPWPYGETIEGNNFNEVVARWNVANSDPDSFYKCVPFLVDDNKLINPVKLTDNGNIYIPSIEDPFGEEDPDYIFDYYCLQFNLNKTLEKIFTEAGYVIVKNTLKISKLNDLFFCGNIIRCKANVYYYIENGEKVYYVRLDNSLSDKLNYSSLMPDIKVLDFVQLAADFLAFDINERLGEVSIYFKKEVLKNAVGARFVNRELSSWEHTEGNKFNGFKLAYSSQGDELDTISISDNDIVEEYQLESDKPDAPGTTHYNSYVKIVSTGRKYKALNLGSDEEPDWQWKRAGRLEPFSYLGGEKEFELSMQLMKNVVWDYYYHNVLITQIDLPSITGVDISTAVENIIASPLFFSLYRGKIVFHENNGHVVPYLNHEYFSIDGLIEFDSSMIPAYLSTNYYFEWLNFIANSKKCTKYIELSLFETINLQWYRRYLVNGIALVLESVAYDVPHKDFAKIEAYTS